MVKFWLTGTEARFYPLPRPARAEKLQEKSERSMMNAPKTVLCIHDLPCFGRASLSVIAPVLAAMGVQPVALPTAVLSTHTGGLGAPAVLADPAFGPAALEHYRRLGVTFDCIYAGYLAGPAQALLVEQAMEYWPTALKVVDPVLGDHGKLYAGITADLVGAMYTLCCRADLILPNLTEAALLQEAPFPTEETAAEAALQLADDLTQLAPQVIVTGVPAGRNLCCVGADRDGGHFQVKTPYIPRPFHGTGDIFGAVLVGRLMRGNVPEAAAEAAARFVSECIRATPEGADERLGVWLETALPLLLAGRQDEA